MNLSLMMVVGTMGRKVKRGGCTNPSGKEQIAEDEEWYLSKEDIESKIVVQIDDAINRRGIMPKRGCMRVRISCISVWTTRWQSTRGLC